MELHHQNIGNYCGPRVVADDQLKVSLSDSKILKHTKNSSSFCFLFQLAVEGKVIPTTTSVVFKPLIVSRSVLVLTSSHSSFTL